MGRLGGGSSATENADQVPPDASEHGEKRPLSIWKAPVDPTTQDRTDPRDAEGRERPEAQETIRVTAAKNCRWTAGAKDKTKRSDPNTHPSTSYNSAQ